MFLSKRNGIWYVFYSNSKGKRTCISTHSNYKSDAIKFLTRFKDELKKREQNNIISVQLEAFINSFLIYSSNVHTYHTSKDYKSELNTLIKHFGNIHLNELTPKLLSDYLRERGKISVYTNSKSLRYLKSIFTWAVKEQYLSENPCKDMKPIN